MQFPMWSEGMINSPLESQTACEERDLKIGQGARFKIKSRVSSGEEGLTAARDR